MQERKFDSTIGACFDGENVWLDIFPYSIIRLFGFIL